MDLPRHLKEEIQGELKAPSKVTIILKEGFKTVAIIRDIEVGDINPSSRQKESDLQIIKATFFPGIDCMVDNVELSYASETEKNKVLLSHKQIQPIFMGKDDSIQITWKLNWE